MSATDYLTHNERRKGAHVSGTYPVLEMPVRVEREESADVVIERREAADVESISLAARRLGAAIVAKVVR